MAGDIKLSSPTTSVVELGKDSGKPVTIQQPNGPGRRNSVSASGVPGLSSRAPAHTRSSSISSTGTSVDSSASTLNGANLSRTNSDLSAASTATSYTKDGTFSIQRKPVPSSANIDASSLPKSESHTTSTTHDLKSTPSNGELKDSSDIHSNIAGDLAGIAPKKQTKDMPHSTPLAGDLETRPSSGKKPDGDNVDDAIANMTKTADDNMRLQMVSQNIQSRQAAISAMNEMNKSLIEATKAAAKDVSDAGEKPS
jgi:hypothetical protein